MRNYLLTLFISTAFMAIQSDACAQSNIVVLLDSKVYYNEDYTQENFSNTKRELCNKVGVDLSRYAGFSNFFSLYAYTSTFDNAIELTEIRKLKKWNEFSINDKRIYADVYKTEAYSNAQDFLKALNLAISRNFNDEIFKSTVFVVLGELGEQFFITNQSPSIFRFIKKNEFDKIHYNYSVRSQEEIYNAEIGENEVANEIFNRDTSQPLRTYILSKYVDNLFTEKTGEKRIIFQCDRKTLPGKDALEIFSLNNNINLPISLTGQSKIKVESCVLTNFKGFDSKKTLTPSEEPVVFSTLDNTMPNELIKLIGANTKFPLFSLLQPYLQLTNLFPFDSVYTGTLAVNYLIVDETYSHAMFSDTINFKITLPELKNIYRGFQRDEILDNVNMIKYGKKKFPNRGVTQIDIADAYQSQIKYGKTIAISLGILIIFFYWFFLRKNKKLTWQNMRTFYK